MKRIFILIIGLLSILDLQAQDNAYGLISGLTVGTQKWNGFERDPLLTWNVRGFYESILNDGLSVDLEFGYHNRGSAILQQGFVSGTNQLVSEYYKMRIGNLSVLGAAKKIYQLKDNVEAYAKLGVRLEYSVTDSFEIFEQYTDAIQPFNYGFTLGGGFHFGPVDGPLQFVLDFQVSPDFSQQIYAPAGAIVNRFTGQPVQFSEQKVVNLSLEVSLGIRFVNKYYDEE
jgi:putative salt-induced outer membrane protein YdiY